MSDEYPKVIDVDGLKVTVTSAEDETRWLHPAAVTDTYPVPDVMDDPDGVPPVESQDADPLDDLTLEMDNPAFQPPKKSTHKKK